MWVYENSSSIKLVYLQLLHSYIFYYGRFINFYVNIYK